MRLVQATVLALSSLLSTGCSRVTEGDLVPSSTEAVPTVSLPQAADACEEILSGHPRLGVEVEQALRVACFEESLARNPATAHAERCPSTVSMARHQSYALTQYQRAFDLLDEEAHPAVRRRIRARIESLALSVQSLDHMNRRFSL